MATFREVVVIVHVAVVAISGVTLWAAAIRDRLVTSDDVIWAQLETCYDQAVSGVEAVNAGVACRAAGYPACPYSYKTQ